MPEWIQQAWVGVAGWLLFLAAVVKTIQSAYAAERDRNALASAKAEREKLDLEIRLLRESIGAAGIQREKLSLEIELLRNSPEVIAERRAIYDRLRALLGQLLEEGSASYEQVKAMYAIWHDSEFAFPRDVANRLTVLNKAVFELYWSYRMLTQPPPGTTEGHRQIAIADNHAALNDVVAFQTDLVTIFRPHLNRAGDQ
jgi:hypothetical protein